MKETKVINGAKMQPWSLPNRQRKEPRNDAKFGAFSGREQICENRAVERQRVAEVTSTIRRGWISLAPGPLYSKKE